MQADFLIKRTPSLIRYMFVCKLFGWNCFQCLFARKEKKLFTKLRFVGIYSLLATKYVFFSTHVCFSYKENYLWNSDLLKLILGWPPNMSGSAGTLFPVATILYTPSYIFSTILKCNVESESMAVILFNVHTFLWFHQSINIESESVARTWYTNLLPPS